MTADLCGGGGECRGWEMVKAEGPHLRSIRAVSIVRPRVTRMARRRADRGSMMAWTIARPEETGYIMFQGTELSPIDVLVFLEVARPVPGPEMEALPTELPGTKGYFQIRGTASSALKEHVESGAELMIRIDTKGYTLVVGFEAHGEPQTVNTPGGNGTSEQFNFIVSEEVYITSNDEPA